MVILCLTLLCFKDLSLSAWGSVGLSRFFLKKVYFCIDYGTA
jgi:hypothetical protein